MPDPIPFENPLIVQFIHPGREYAICGTERRNTVHIPWVGGESDARCGHGTVRHTRRFVAHDGQYVDANGQLMTGKLGFWTEWEACSTAVAMPPSDDGNTAHWVHTVESPLLPTTEVGSMNTDPCAFGSSFKYCCCQQTVTGVMRKLSPGSLILFGTHMSNRFFLDTVFVVDSRKDYTTGDTANLASSEYQELSLNRLGKGCALTFYRGKPYSQMSIGPYSFTPARLFNRDDARCGERFVLDVDAVNRTLSQTSRQLAPELNQHFKRIDANAQTIVCVWNEIVRQIRVAGFVQGVHFDWPQ